MVSSCRVTEQGTTIDLKKLVIKARNAEYNPKVPHQKECFLHPNFSVASDFALLPVS